MHTYGKQKIMNNNIQSLINDNPMSRFQMVAVLICMLINMLDGFDVLVMAFTAHSISEEWGLSGKTLGILFSSGLFGMAFGAMFLGPLADKYGRRALIITCLVIITTGMLLSSFTESLYQLATMRVITGTGIGGALASVNIITAEYSSDKRRGLAISLVQIGYPLGGILGGGVASLLISDAGWRSVFVFGAALSAIMIPVVMWRLPESIDYLLAKRPSGALQRINHLLRGMRHNEISALPEPELQVIKHKASLRALWGKDLRAATILMWTTFFMVMASLYFVLSWTPKLLVHAGLSTQQGISGGMILHLGGITGQLVLGFISARLNLQKLTGTYMILAAIFISVFAVYSNDLTLAMYAAAFVGFFLMGSITGLYALSPKLYPTDIRTTGMGWAIGIGRIGAIISPFMAGILLDQAWTTSSLFFVFATPMVIAMLAILFIHPD
jgi:MFS transporter, AAHS family, vanillate permease